LKGHLQTIDACLSLSALSQYVLQFLPPAFWQTTKHFSDEQPPVSANATDGIAAGTRNITRAAVIPNKFSRTFFNPPVDQCNSKPPNSVVRKKSAGTSRICCREKLRGFGGSRQYMVVGVGTDNKCHVKQHANFAIVGDKATDWSSRSSLHS
jgi:hypothetical protein